MRGVALVCCAATIWCCSLIKTADAQTDPVNPALYYPDYQAVTTPPPSSISAPAIAPSPTPAPLTHPPLLPPASPTSPAIALPTTSASPDQTAPRSIEFGAPLAPPSTWRPVDFTEAVVLVRDIQVIGGTPELQELVRDTLQTQVGATVSGTQLQDDVTALRDTGFFANADVQIEPLADGTRVVYLVEPVVVQSIQLVDARILPQAVVEQAFRGQLGQPINPIALQQGAGLVDQWYLDNGYTLAQVVAVQPDRTGVLRLQVVEVVVRQVRFRFLNQEGGFVDESGEPISGRTQERFLQQQIATQPGAVFNEQTARDDLQRIQALQLFQSASVDLQVDGTVADVTFNLNERLSRSFNVGGGVNNDVGLYGTVTYQDRNVGGIGEQLGLDVQISGRGLQFGGRFTSPYRDSNPDRLGYSLYAFRRRALSPTFTEEVTLPNGDRVREGRLGAGVSVMRPVGEWDAELGLNYNRISLRDADGDIAPVDELGNDLTLSGTGLDDLFTLSLRATQDDRDNPTNPSRGSVLTLSTEQSIPIGNGNILMNRLRANYSQFVPVDWLGNGSLDNPEVLAFNVQAGTVLGDLPPYEAFNLGGTNSVRGYGAGDVGSGRRYAQATVEYRFPLFDPVGAVVFADVGTDLGSADEVPGEPANLRDKPGSGLGAGAGVRINTPLGLFRFDFGVNDQGDNRLHFGFGQRF